MKKLAIIIAAAMAALLVSSCTPKYEGVYTADLTVLQKGIKSTISINEDGTAKLFLSGSEEARQATWEPFVDSDNVEHKNCIRIDFGDISKIPYIMDFSCNSIYFGELSYFEKVGHKFQALK